MSKLMPGDDFTVYLRMRDGGMDAAAVHARMKADGLDGITRTRALRYVFNLSLEEAKHAMVGGSAALAQAQEQVVDGLELLAGPR